MINIQHLTFTYQKTEIVWRIWLWQNNADTAYQWFDSSLL